MIVRLRGSRGKLARNPCYNCIYAMRYEWDERKNWENQRKHGVSFELASRVFEDEDRLILLDRVDKTGEQRWLAIGTVP
jgi:uncharacterized DUF497 family protein